MKKLALVGLQKKFWRGLLGSKETSIFSPASKPGLRVYQDAYFLRIYDSLAADFQIVARELGEKRFRSLVKDYLKKNPSQHFSLRYMGKKFPSFLAKNKIGKAKPWLVEAALYEWFKLDLYDVPDHPIIQQEDLQKLPPEKWDALKIHFISHLQIRLFRFSVEDADSISCKAPVEHLALWRKKEDVYYRRIETLELKMIRLLQRKKTFGATCAGLAKNFKTAEDTAAFAFQTLSRWIFDEVIEKID